jgi:hypothetical protein
MSRVLISIITDSKKEDSENAISNNLETQNFQNFPSRHQLWYRLAIVVVGPTKFINKLPTPWVTQLWYLHKHTMQVHLADQIQSIKAQCNAFFPKICFWKCSHFSSRGGKIQKIFWGRIPPDSPPPTSTYDTTPNFLSPTTICHISPHSI